MPSCSGLLLQLVEVIEGTTRDPFYVAFTLLGGTPLDLWERCVAICIQRLKEIRSVKSLLEVHGHCTIQ